MDLVSILLPCYNHEKYIDDCMESLCSQTYKEIELIIVDDCSTDNSFEILKNWKMRLETRFSKIYIGRNEVNLGVTKNLNRMLEMANGKYIKLLATDDMLLPDAIENFVNFTEKRNDDIIFSNVATIPESAKYPIVSIDGLCVRYDDCPSEGKGLTGVICGDNYISAPGVFFPKRTFETYGVFDEEYMLEDFEYWLRVSINGSFAYMNQVTALYRQNDMSLSRFNVSEVGKKRHRNFHKQKMSIFQKYKRYANEEQIKLFYNNELNSAIGLNDNELTNEIIKSMKDGNISITHTNKVRAFLVNLGVYIIFKSLKRKFN